MIDMNLIWSAGGSWAAVHDDADREITIGVAVSPSH